MRRFSLWKTCGRAFLLAGLVLVLGGAGVGTAASGESNIDIVAIGLSGRQTNLTQDPGWDLAPAVTRDGRIVFLSTRDGYPNLYVMNGNGRELHRLTNSPVDHSGIAGAEDLQFSQAAWSPRGDQIAFDGEYWAAPPDCEQHCVSWRLLIIGSDGRGVQQIAPDGRAPAWSPDGRRLAFETGIGAYFEAGAVAMTRLDGSGSVRVQANNNSSDVGPVWSPSGREIAFQAQGSIYLVRSDGRRKRRLAAGHNPSWSPDGRRLAFIDHYRLFIVDRNGRGKRRVSRKGEFVTGAAWSAKGGMLGYVAGTTADPGGGLPRHLRVETASADGKRVHVLARESATSLIWGNPVWTPDGKRILVAVESH